MKPPWLWAVLIHRDDQGGPAFDRMDRKYFTGGSKSPPREALRPRSQVVTLDILGLRLQELFPHNRINRNQRVNGPTFRTAFDLLSVRVARGNPQRANQTPYACS